MRFSICVMADVDEIGFFSHAEAFGYDSVWVTDSQMLFSDCYAVLALAAQQTRRIRLGPGVAICGTLIPPVHVAAMATLNRIAPGRVHLTLAPGFLATRSVGRPRATLAAMREAVSTIRRLLRGETVAVGEGATRLRNVSAEPTPVYMLAAGPRMVELAGEIGRHLGATEGRGRELGPGQVALRQRAEQRAERVALDLDLGGPVAAHDQHRPLREPRRQLIEAVCGRAEAGQQQYG